MIECVDNDVFSLVLFTLLWGGAFIRENNERPGAFIRGQMTFWRGRLFAGGVYSKRGVSSNNYGNKLECFNRCYRNENKGRPVIKSNDVNGLSEV